MVTLPILQSVFSETTRLLALSANPVENESIGNPLYVIRIAPPGTELIFIIEVTIFCIEINAVSRIDGNGEGRERRRSC